MDWKHTGSAAALDLPDGLTGPAAVGTAGAAATSGLRQDDLKPDSKHNVGGRAACAVIR